MNRLVKLFFSLALLGITSVLSAMPSDDLPAPLTLPRAQRPAWVREQGIVMAGNWEPLIARVRRDDINNVNCQPSADQLRLYRFEQSQQMIDELKKLGVNFVMTHGYKCFGLNAEMPDMLEAARFAELCHKNGMHVGCYVFSGTLGWEMLRKEVSESIDWELLDADNQPIPYPGKPYRHFFNRNRPDTQAYLHRVMDFAMNRMKVDLLHLDNYSYGPGYDQFSIQLFRNYLKLYYKPAELGVSDFSSVVPPKNPAATDALGRAWIDFTSQMLADSLYDMSKYARSVRPDILMECNPGGIHPRIYPPKDHARLLRYGEAFWDEGGEPGYKDGKLQTRLLTYRAAQTLDNMVFVYIRNPLQAAESLAHNTDCLGCICQFEYGKITVPSGDPLTSELSPDILPYVRFFHEQRPYYRDAERVPDVAVLRSFASELFVGSSAQQATERFEQYCIESSVPWAMIFDQHLADLRKYKALSLVGADALSDEQVAYVKNYIRHGGGLVLTEETGKFNERMVQRASNPFSDLRGERIVRVKADASREEAVAAVQKACGGSLSLAVTGPAYLLAEMTEQTKQARRLVHLVNYSPSISINDITVNAQLPRKWNVKRVTMLTPESPNPQPIEFRQEGRRVVCRVRQINVYGLLSIECAH